MWSVIMSIECSIREFDFVIDNQLFKLIALQESYILTVMNYS